MRRLTENYSALLLGKHATFEEADRPAGASSLGVIIQQQERECFKAGLVRGVLGSKEENSAHILSFGASQGFISGKVPLVPPARSYHPTGSDQKRGVRENV